MKIEDSHDEPIRGTLNLDHHEILDDMQDDEHSHMKDDTVWSYVETFISCITLLAVVFMFIAFTWLWATDPATFTGIDYVNSLDY